MLTKGARWVPPAAGPGFMRATQEAGLDLAAASTYGDTSNTIIVENTDDVVWLVIHTVAGDHPSEFKIDGRTL